jgi:hypothetical protein
MQLLIRKFFTLSHRMEDRVEKIAEERGTIENREGPDFAISAAWRVRQLDVCCFA